MAEAEKVIYTAEGFKKLQDELSERQTKISSEISSRLAEARAQGDLSENSEYDEAKEAQAKNESRIQELIALLKNAEVLADDEISKTKVSLGCTVVLRDEETKEEETYTVVNANEENIFENKLSKESPVGVAIMDKKIERIKYFSQGIGCFIKLYFDAAARKSKLKDQERLSFYIREKNKKELWISDRHASNEDYQAILRETYSVNEGECVRR